MLMDVFVCQMDLHRIECYWIGLMDPHAVYIDLTHNSECVSCKMAPQL
jgi:hypothetical protein